MAEKTNEIGIVKSFSIRDCKTKDGAKFSMVDYTIQNEKSGKIDKGSVGAGFLKEYLAQLQKHSSELINSKCEYYMKKREFVGKDGKVASISEAKGICFLNEKGERLEFIDENAEKENEMPF